MSASVNTNGVESGILGERIIGCISENGYLKNSVLNKDFDIFKECGIDKRFFRRGSNFYFNVSVYNNGIVITNFTAGDYSFERDCSIVNKVSASKFAKCSEKTEIVLNDKNEIIKIHVLTGSNQQGGRIN